MLKALTSFKLFSGMDFLAMSKRRNNGARKLVLAAGITAICLLIFKTSPGFSSFMKVKFYSNLSSYALHSHLLLQYFQ